MNRAFFGGYASCLRCLTALLLCLACCLPVLSFGIVAGVPVHGMHTRTAVVHLRRKPAAPGIRALPGAAGKGRRSHVCRLKKQRIKSCKISRKKAVLPPPPQVFASRLRQRLIAPGVLYKSYRGQLNINVLDVDLLKAPVQVRPMMAGETFHHLADVKDHARLCQAIAAVNANYFKGDGTPLGTLIINKEWIAGPLYDRVSLGITKSGLVRMERVNLNGILETSSPENPSIWVNNVNQPRRHGSRLILYTGRWGSSVHMKYAGCLIAVNAGGQVIDRTTTAIDIPPGGFVLSDSKSGQIARLKTGDLVRLSWHTDPPDWSDVEQAVSGGPMLIKDGKLYLDLKAEKFGKTWTGRQIQARTAAGVTADNHLLLVTIEGSHTLWDFAKFLRKLGAVDAMNLDGGGSTTMVVNGVTVTRNANRAQRRVASSLAIIDLASAHSEPGSPEDALNTDMTSFCLPELTGLFARDGLSKFLPVESQPVSKPACQPAEQQAGKPVPVPLSLSKLARLS